MSVIRIKKRTMAYVTLNISALNDPRLSFRAKGLHTYLMSKPDDWKVYIVQLEKESPREGREAVAGALKELEAAGYIRRTRQRDSKGRMAGWDTTIFETPDLAVDETPTENGFAEVGPTEIGLTELGSTEVGKTVATYSCINSILKEPNLEKTQNLPLNAEAPATRSKAKTAARRKTLMPIGWDQQVALRQSIIDTALLDWIRERGLILDLDAQWDMFVRKALANGYRYLDWRSAFQNWLTSPYQLTERPKTQAQINQERRKALEAWANQP